MTRDEDCIFCKILNGDIPCVKIFEDDKVLAFMDIMPLNKGHLLVIPKIHVGNLMEIDPLLYGHIAAVTSTISRAVKKAVNPDGINIMQLNGKAANQVVPHLHMHLVPRWEGDGLTICSWTPVMGEQAEIEAVAEQIKSSL
jgi:histidine triad (HIT) family protein